MSEHDEMREAVRADVIRALGPPAVHNELKADRPRPWIDVEIDEQAAGEMESYARAWAERKAREAAYIADRRSLAGAYARRLSDGLPEGMRFEWTGDDVPPGYFRAAAGNLVREDDPLAIAFRKLADLMRAWTPTLALLAAVQRERVSAMHRDYRRRQLARRRKG